MADYERHPSRAEQRMLAVAKLRRAASLPRMKDGRRPPMHVEAVSEGEKGASEGEKSQTDSDLKEELESPPILNSGQQETEVTTATQIILNVPNGPIVETDVEAGSEVIAEEEADAEVNIEERTVSPSPSTRTRRRRRSNSRSRTSKDMKGKIRPGGDSSQDEALYSTPFILPGVPLLMSPIPSHLAALSHSHLLRSPGPSSPEPHYMYPGTSPSTPLPIMPSLEAIQKNISLNRSNSVGNPSAGRRMAMHKLTGGMDSYDPSPSPSPSQQPGKLSRNNTVSGGERVAARQLMLSRLGGRITKEAETDIASGGEDRGAPSPTPKRRRRRSRRGSSSAVLNASVSDSELVSNSQTTPIVPPTPLPHLYLTDNMRAQSGTANQTLSPKVQSTEEIEETPLDFNEKNSERPEYMRRRSVVVEEDDEDEDRLLQELRKSDILPQTPLNRLPEQVVNLWPPHSSGAPPHTSSDLASPSAIGVPLFVSQRTPSRNELFLSSPFPTPLKERHISDDDEEQVLYHGDKYRSRTLHNAENLRDREISWIASPVPEIRMPIDDDDDGDDNERGEEHAETEEEHNDNQDEEGPLSASSSQLPPFDHSDSPSTRMLSLDCKNVAIESEASLDMYPSFIPASPSSSAAIHHSIPIARASDDSMPPQSYPTRLSVASRIQSDRSPGVGEFAEWEERVVGGESSSKKNGEHSSPSPWEKLKSTFARAGPNTGRRSRSNSIARERRDYTDSSISRESGASIVSAKTDRGDSVTQSPQLLMQTPSASASILSLAPHAPPRGSASPIPSASSADLLRYQHAKLFPFPGMRVLEEQRNKAKSVPLASSSTPDITSLFNAGDDIQTPTSVNSFQSSDISKEKNILHQASDTRLFGKYGSETMSPMSPSIPGRSDYFQIHPPSQQNGGSSGLKLPMTLPGVKQWLSKNNKKKTQQPSPGISTMSISYPIIDMQAANSIKPSLSDLLKRKGTDLGTDWEDVGNMPSTASADTLPDKALATHRAKEQTEESGSSMSTSTGRVETDHEKTPKAKKSLPLKYNFDTSVLSFDASNRSEQIVSPTPEPPSSSFSDDPLASMSESSSATSSEHSIKEGIRRSQGGLLLERLDESLGRRSRSPMWASVIDDPPRKLLISSPVLQVVNPNTVKDRFLFLFTDILVIAKPVLQDQDMLENYRPSPLDRKYVVKNIVHLRHLRFGPDRLENHTKSLSNSFALRNPLIEAFVKMFSEDPSRAISMLLSESEHPETPGLIGQLLFKAIDLNRAKLGEYLARRQSKSDLIAYLDSFGFLGLRIDKALRVFLYSVLVPSRTSNYNPLDYLLDAFASRWYEANAKIVAYDKDMAIRLVRALVQLNDLVHDGISPRSTASTWQIVHRRDFVDAFRRYDVRCLVSDEHLAEIFESIRQERLCQARDPATGPNATLILFKRPLPSRLTYKVQSEPIVLRIPQADSDLTLYLHGQDLIFDPPVLTFARSSEVSFRVSGTSLGSKTMTICRGGLNALNYGGLPLSSNITVERAFMRNTFQLAFLNHNGKRRRYMFSVDDPLIRHQWAVSLKREIVNVISVASNTSARGSAPTASKFCKAAESIAFKVLQETLIGPRVMKGRVGRPAAQNRDRVVSSDDPLNGPLHARTMFQSRLAHCGAGKNEVELGPDTSGMDTGHDYEESALRVNKLLLWSGRDLKLQCQQNSSIPLVLAFMQIGAPGLDNHHV